MHRTDVSPAPINLVTTWTVFLYQACRSKDTCFPHPNKHTLKLKFELFPESLRKKDKYKRMKPDMSSRLSTNLGGEGGSVSRLKAGKVSPFHGDKKTAYIAHDFPTKRSIFFLLDGPSPTFTDGGTASGFGAGGHGAVNLPLGSTESMRGRTFLENAIRWRPIVRKYK